MRLDELARDPEPETEPPIPPDPDGPLESAEDPLLVLAGDPDAFVPHREERAIATAFDPDVDRLAATKLEGVEEQVGDDVLEAGGVPAANHRQRRFHIQPRFGRRSEAISDLPGKRAEIDGLPIQFDAGLLQADGVEELMDQAVDPQDLAQGGALVVDPLPRRSAQPLDRKSVV